MSNLDLGELERLLEAADEVNIYHFGKPELDLDIRDSVEALLAIARREERALRHIDAAWDVIEAADMRAAAADGPVLHVRDTMSDSEWRTLYVELTKARAALTPEEGQA